MSLRLRHVLLVCGAVCLVVGSGAFSAASVERGVSVSVADDEDAYLGLTVPDELQVASARPGQGGAADAGPANGTGANASGGGASSNAGAGPTANSTAAGSSDGAPGQQERTVELLAVTNRFPTTVDVTVELDARPGMPRMDPGERTVELRPGERTPIEVTVTCSAGRPSKVVTLHVTAVGDGVSVEATREVTVSCTR